MSELDGVTLSQSEIFVGYRELVDRGYVVSDVVRGHHLVLKMTHEGDTYCREVLYPGLFSSSGEPSGGKTKDDFAVPVESMSEFKELEGLTIEEIKRRIAADHLLGERIARASDPEGALRESSRDIVRNATVQLAIQMTELRLPNFEAAQADACTRIVLILADAPAASKKDVAHFVAILSAIPLIGSAAWLTAHAIRAYLLAN